MTARKGFRVRSSPTKPAPTFKVRPLVPSSPGVDALYRVEEQVGDKKRTHLVFVDRWGIYCEEHAFDCPTVAPATKEHKRLTKGR